MFFRSSNLEDERLYTPLEVAFLRGQVTAFSILVRAGSDLTHFRWLLNLNSGPAFANSLSHWVLPSASMTSSGGKAAAAMVRCARHRLREFDACHSVVPPLISLCIRPALQVLIADARRRHIELIDVVASLSSDVTDNVRRLLTFSHLDDVIPLSPSSVASPTSPPCGQDFIEWPAVDKPIAADCGTPSNGKTASSLLFNSVPKTSRSLPQTPAYLPKPRCQSPPKQPDNFVYSDINSNVTVTSSDRRFGKISQTPTRGRMLPRPKSSASDRYQYDTTVRSTLLTNSNARVTSAQSRSDETARRAVIPPRPKSSASDRKQFVRRPLSVTPMHAYDASGVTRPGEPLRRRLPSTPVNEAGGSRPWTHQNDGRMATKQAAL